ncbi:hypothetical protein DVH24_009885 [Malus domestica]|uniref:Uncharacterized protein n=1 Tax=Malus domestica TaxID=3750 RepID=A0A498JQ44_MALDO|nr:hypothetical protein DVH24_009885 [Malus domestica]
MKLTVCKKDDCIGILQPQDDPFIISVEIANYELTLVFIDNGSSINVIFLLDFDQLGVNRDILNGNLEPLIPFGDNIIHPIEEMNLMLSIGSMSAMVCYASAVKLNTKVTTDWFVQTLGGSLTLNPSSC